VYTTATEPLRLVEKWPQRDVDGSRAFLLDTDRMNSHCRSARTAAGYAMKSRGQVAGVSFVGTGDRAVVWEAGAPLTRVSR
jgi:hypothetical protein